MTKVELPLHHPPLFVTCSAYAGFAVKERQSEDDEGDYGITIVSRQPGLAPVPCNDNVAPGEVSLNPALSPAAFMGVIGRYVFVTQGDDDLFGWNRTNVFRTDSPEPITLLSLAWTDRTNRLTRLRDGFDLRFMTDVSENCGVHGAQGAACLARLEQASGAKITRAKCLKAVPASDPGDPVALEYPALPSVRGVKAVLRATGPGLCCVASH